MAYVYNVNEGRLIISTKDDINYHPVQEFHVINGDWDGKIDVVNKTIEIYHYKETTTTCFETIRPAIKGEHQYY